MEVGVEGLGGVWFGTEAQAGLRGEDVLRGWYVACLRRGRGGTFLWDVSLRGLVMRWVGFVDLAASAFAAGVGFFVAFFEDDAGDAFKFGANA